MPPRAAAHPGHDHAVSNGVWPQHAANEPVEAVLAASGPGFAVSPAAPAVEPAPVVEPAVAAIDASLDRALRSLKLATGVGGTSSDAGVDAVVGQTLADINTVAYDDDFLYVRTSGVPSHAVGPFNNPSTPGDLDATYRIPLNPTEQTGAKTVSVYELGAIGVMVNGVAFFSAWDSTFWRPPTNQLTDPGTPQPAGGSDWNVNALWRRAGGMDAARGHPAPLNNQTNPDGSVKGSYHYHMHPVGLLDQIDPDNTGAMGSPIVGYAFDGYPIVGPYAYEPQPDGSLLAVPMTSSYGLRTERVSLSDNANGNPTPFPSTADYELGSFIEDFVYLDGSGTLNEYNMAFVKFDAGGRAVLADQSDPDGDWAYFITLDAMSANDTTLDGDVAWPYIVGPEFYGVYDDAGRRLVVPDDVTFYFEQLTADFNKDRGVDAADYALARDLVGAASGALFNDPTGQPVGSSQQNLFMQNFGAALGGPTPAAAIVSAIPEPAGFTLIAYALAAAAIGRCRRAAPPLT
ncbi:MAG: YHYH protein [Planctomycetota bacterium]